MSLRKRTIRQLSSGLAKRLAKLYNESSRHTKQLKSLLVEVEESESEHRALKRQVAHLASEHTEYVPAGTDIFGSAGVRIDPGIILGLVSREGRNRRNRCEVEGHRLALATHMVWMVSATKPNYYYKVCPEHYAMAHPDRRGG